MPDVGLRWSSAKILLDDQRYDEATRIYVWLWNNIPGFDPSWMGPRQSSIAAEIASLVGVHSPAGAVFSAIRDASAAAAPVFDLGDWFGPRVDWLLLNRVLGEEKSTLDWFDGVKADQRYASVIEHLARLLLGPLKERHRWADIGCLFRDPLACLAEARKFMGRVASPDVRESENSSRLTRYMASRFRDDAVVLYAGLRAAGRTGDAKALRAEALRLDPSDEMRLALERAPVPYH